MVEIIEGNHFTGPALPVEMLGKGNGANVFKGFGEDFLKHEKNPLPPRAPLF